MSGSGLWVRMQVGLHKFFSCLLTYIRATMDFWIKVVIYLAVVLSLFQGLAWLAKTAALRGQKGKPLNDNIQRLIRIVFFSVMVFPLVYIVPYSIPFVLLYMYTYIDLSEIRGGRPSNFFVRLPIWRWLSQYLQLKIVSEITEDEVESGHPYVMGIHPHAILPLGGILNVVSPVNEFREGVGKKIALRGLAASFVFFIPGYRDLCLAAGLCDAARYSAHRLLNDGFSLFVVPGGATEALYSRPDEDICYIRKRKGFVRLAIQHGASLIPVFSFNENNQYDQFDTKSPWVQTIKKNFQSVFGISLPLLKNILPRRCRITTVVGKPIHTEKVEDPSDELVEQVLEQYIEELVALYNRHSHFNIPAGKKITII